MKICIDPGHGGFDSGAVGPTLLMEKDVNLSISLKLAEILKFNGIDVVLTREKDENPARNSRESLKNRVDFANSIGADYFISIHCNSAADKNASGSEVYCYSLRSPAKSIAEQILKELVDKMGFRNRGVKTRNFYVLKHTKMPACLVEVAFISNIKEEAILKNENMQKKIALCIARGIGNALGITIYDIKQGKVIAKSGLNVRKGPTLQSPIVQVLKYGEVVKVYEIIDGWYRVDGGWVFGRYIEFI
ncbi:N-acetylmuramoyl-L-alanine amidase [Thermobrachium celere]|uniref:N-acetylmuramoyl-L-alanine amidase n=1 Tax=Thermobrachium celere DSM 8682 TaxID=941824 RepID=R7RSM2_9CLOT|nr:N-acetylmuramoyl-L-alanine amidase [Thermobrachium celere]CDF59197.1 N-acetylmuramoyl-L-alanine amidase [Thermobrachium celere DSM 8682]